VGETSAIGPLPDYNDAAHTFELRNIPSGAWELFVVFQPNTADGYIWQRHAGRGLVRVADHAFSDVELEVKPNADLSGQIVMEGSPSGRGLDFRNDYPSLTSVEPIPEVLDVGPTLARLRFVESDGRFRVPGGVAPGRYWLGFMPWRLPPGVYLDAATMEGENILGAPLTLAGGTTNRVVLRLRRDGGSIRGTVSDRGRRSLDNASVVVAPLDDQGAGPMAHTHTATNVRRVYNRRNPTRPLRDLCSPPDG
jgi:hypothetical protein